MNRLKVIFLKHWKTLLKAAVAVLLLVLVIKGSSHQLRTIDFFVVTTMLRHLGPKQIATLVVFGIVAVSSMTLYDYAIIRHFKHSIKPWLFFNIAFVANTLNNLLGMGGLSGAAARTVLLRKNNVSLNLSIYYNLLLAPATPTGLSLLGLVVLFWPGVTQRLLLSYPWLYLGVAGVVLILPLFFFSDRIIDKTAMKTEDMAIHRDVKVKLQLVLVSLIEWLAAFLFFYYVCIIYCPNIHFTAILCIYTLAAIAGIMSFLPGGLGSFDVVALLGLQLAGMDVSLAAAVLILFRVFFFIVPTLLGVLSLVANLTMDRVERLFPGAQLMKMGLINTTVRYYKTYGDFINTLVSMLVFAAGGVLLISSIRPGLSERLSALAFVLPASVSTFARLAAVIIGFMLCVLAVEVLYKVHRAHVLTFALLISGILVTLLKGLDFEEAVFLFIVLLLLRLAKPNLYRYSVPVRLSKFFLVAALGLASIFAYYAIAGKIWVAFLAHKGALHAITAIGGKIMAQAIVTFVIFGIFLVFLYVMKRPLEKDERFTPPDFDKLSEFLDTSKGTTFTHLLYLGDKNIYWAAEGQVALSYAKFHNQVVVLGDPIGNEALFSVAIQEFQAFLDKYGFEAVFYEISEKYLSTYHDNGYYFFKLGEEAVVDVSAFSMAGGDKRNMRNTYNSFSKKGFIVEILDPPYDNSFMADCREVSREWLGKRKEMGFSLGWFNESYLQRSQIAQLRAPDGQLLAFVSLMPGYNGGQTVATDLMRFRKELPHGAMDYLMLSLMLKLQEMGTLNFNMGMAPLSNVGNTPYSHSREKLARVVYHFGKFFYSFEGLRKYKEKFGPQWKPRYLAYPQLTSLPATLLEISMLVSSQKSKRRVHN